MKKLAKTTEELTLKAYANLDLGLRWTTGLREAVQNLETNGSFNKSVLTEVLTSMVVVKSQLKNLGSEETHL